MATEYLEHIAWDEHHNAVFKRVSWWDWKLTVLGLSDKPILRITDKDRAAMKAKH